VAQAKALQEYSRKQREIKVAHGKKKKKKTKKKKRTGAQTGGDAID
jgi:hypothetical protein